MRFGIPITRPRQREGGGEESIRSQACHDEGFYVTTGMGIPTHGHRKPFLGRNALFAEQSRRTDVAILGKMLPLLTANFMELGIGKG
ncbi:hypothetical protein SCLCIDRAFT_278746 [Scleroderma citrinum Foug A]|uniref:Uncharacterized protein n=1 Tax=Scleroderma citrinum Foug A TaxID=1036808 RepID=A0A0C3D581_9AGAM|nr:hypothetical protein SCLCIDRAFT_278746 [Scleroderma citrinum Foug A]